MHEYNNIFLCKIITQYTCTCLHSIAVETESTLVDIIVKGCMHVFSNNIPCMASLLYKFSEHTFHPGILFCTLETPKEVLVMYSKQQPSLSEWNRVVYRENNCNSATQCSRQNFEIGGCTPQKQPRENAGATSL